MSTATTPRATGPMADRAVPALDGLNVTLLGIKLKRLLRNRRSMVFTVVMPAAFLLIFGVGQDYGTQSAGRGNVIAYVMVSMVL